MDQFLKKHHHLPNILSADEVEAQGGIILNKTIEMQLEKIEELYLHLIELDKKIDQLEEHVEVLSNLIEKDKNNLFQRNRNFLLFRETKAFFFFN